MMRPPGAMMTNPFQMVEQMEREFFGNDVFGQEHDSRGDPRGMMGGPSGFGRSPFDDFERMFDEM